MGRRAQRGASRGWGVKQIGADQQLAAARTLAAAFHDDPLLQVVQPDPERRRATGTWFMVPGPNVSSAIFSDNLCPAAGSVELR